MSRVLTRRAYSAGNPAAMGAAAVAAPQTIYSSTTDGYIASSAAGDNYTVARAGSESVAASTSSGELIVGQSSSFGYAYVWESFLNFTVSGVTGTVNAASLELNLTTDSSTTDFTIEVRQKDWGATLTAGDYVAGDSLSGLTLLGSLSTSGIGDADQYKAITENGTALKDAVVAAIAGDGVLRLIVHSSRSRTGDAPTGDEMVIFYSANSGGTTADPRLKINGG